MRQGPCFSFTTHCTTASEPLGATATLVMLMGTEASVSDNHIYDKIFSAGHLLRENSTGKQKGLQESVRPS